MSQFVPTTFGLDAINTVKGTLEIEGATNLGILTLIDPMGSSPQTNLSSLDHTVYMLDTNPGHTFYWAINLPLLTSVPVGTKITFKRTNEGAAPRVQVRGTSPDQLDDLPTGQGARINQAWTSITLYSDGNRWLIIEYFDGSI